MICEQPKIGPLRDPMRERIAEITGLNVSRIAVKATTSERLGFTGREEASPPPRAPPSACPGAIRAGATEMSGSDARALSRSLLDLCRMRKLTIATAESCTGGLVAGALTDIPGSSDVIDRGFVTYSNDAKRAMLGVKATTLGDVRRGQQGNRDRDGHRRAGESRCRSCRLHYRHRRSGRCDTGQAGGLVHLAVAARDGRILHRECRFGAIGRSAVRQRSVVEALRMLTELARGPQAPAKPRRESPAGYVRGWRARRVAARSSGADRRDLSSRVPQRYAGFRKSRPRAFRMPPQTSETRCRTSFPSASPASGS